MSGSIQKKRNTTSRRPLRRKRWTALVLCLAVLVGGGTIALLTYHAIAMTETERVLDCPFAPTTGEGYADYAVHIHTGDCYDGDGRLVCPLPEIAPHTHTELCYAQVRGERICALEENPGHEHTPDCYALVRGERICGLEEDEDHLHTDECYAWTTERICALEEGEGSHVHTDDCYRMETERICGLWELHTHTGECYDGDGRRICGLLQLEEHVHGPGCFREVRHTAGGEETGESPAVSDPEADVESWGDYGPALESMDRSGPWNEVLAAVARTQLGHGENERNFVLGEDGRRHGYTRYGDWYGDPYGEWSGMFVSFCLHFSLVPTDAFPSGSDPARWAEQLRSQGLYAPAEDHVPRTGDVVFFDEDRDRLPDQMGIVTAVLPERAEIETVEGGRTDTVGSFRYSLAEETILGYGVLPERPAAEEPAPEEAFDPPAETPLASVTAANGEALGAGTSVRAALLSGAAADPARSEVEAYLTAALPADLRPARSPAKAAAGQALSTAGTAGAAGTVEAAESVRSETRSQVLEIGLETADGDDAVPEGGFRVSVTLPEPLVGRDFHLYHVAGSGVEELAVTLEGREGDDGQETVTGFTFLTGSFSSFVLRYTVDFHLGDRAFALEGDGRILLSELLEALGIPQPAAGVTDCAFSDPSLLEIRREADGDWRLRSLAPFDTEESLRLTFADGTVLVVRVTDAQIRQTVISADGETYEITLTYDESAGIPEDAVLRAEELTEIDDYLAQAGTALSGRAFALARFFDIAILSGDDEIQPAAPVQVEIRLADLHSGSAAALHFGDEVEILDARVDGEAVLFQADGFSVYGVVTMEPLPSAETLEELDGNSFYISIDYNQGRFYCKNTLNGNYIARTDVSELSSASLYTFEKVEGAEDRFFIYTFDENGEKAYVQMREGSTAFSFSPDVKTPFVVVPRDDGGFYIYYERNNGNKCAWSYNGAGFIGAVQGPGNNNRIVLTKAVGSDPYGLDGRSYGIVNNQNTVSGTAVLTGASNNGTRLSGRVMTVRTEPIKRTENVFVAKNSSIPMWTFTSISADRYYITAEVSGALKYLRISDSAVTLVDAADVDENCVISVEAGTGAYSGKYKFSSGGSVLRLNGTTFDRVGDLTTDARNGNVWMNLAELSSLNEDDFVVYTAEKVSVSGTVNEDGTIDYDVKDGDVIVLYTRIWNDTTKRYEYYAVDYDGMLVRAYESGDTISWVGSKVNTMLWDFTEYHNDDGTPNYYYELQNRYSGKYIAPQVTGDGFLSDDTIGINLNGRRNGEYYTTVLAWDDPYYDYASLKVQDWQLTSAPISKADTFYFAMMSPAEDEDALTTVATIDHTPYGITLKMQDYENIVNGRSADQIAVLGNTPYNQWSGSPGLLQRNLTGDYPDVVGTGRSLSELYGSAMTVNHQFLMSTYQETGYFEYDCTQNFAHLITSAADPWYGQPSPGGGTYGVGDFVVYGQLGTSTEGNKDTLKHGQFFPYNDLTEGYFSQYLNERDIHAAELSSLDPRKGEKLYAIKFQSGKTAPDYVDHFFGMEMSASFMQSESGLDAWGHDLIFEFSGDDDFWLYVDGKLVLDLGGIHSALDGSINFRTGRVVVNNRVTNLRELYRAAYMEEHPSASAAEADLWLDGIFKENEDGVRTVFKDYSGHTMRMFYMERGAGASNLHMRFNLAPYTNGEILLEKEVSGVENVDAGMRFPFQILYRDGSRPDDAMQYATDAISVTDAQTGDPIPYQSVWTTAGLTYEHVFFLRPGQTASVRLPDEDTEYQIVECGLNTTTFDQVRVNGEPVEGLPTAEDDRQDFPTDADTVADRKKVIYDNHVSDGVQNSLLITKKLWEDYEKTREITAEDDDTGFRFRVYIGKVDGSYTVYNTGKYYVKDPNGFYCVYQDGGFVSTGLADFDALSADVPPGEWKSQQEQATFHTSPGGAVDKIPAGYTVEIPGLMEGTAFLVEERDSEIPSGYHRIDYTRPGETDPDETANAGVIRLADKEVIVNNQHGYGLHLDKIWSDADFMTDHDEIYFAVYRKDGTDALTMVDGSLRQLGRTETAINWFFPELDEDTTLNDYRIYEVLVTVPEGGALSVDAGTGEVTGFASVTRIEEGGILTAGGVTNEHGYSTTYDYTASYTRETLTEEQLAGRVNSRTDTVSNTRPGIRLVKTDPAGAPLAGAVFSLTKSGDPSVRKSFTSDENGLIAVAYLTPDEDYILTETQAPYRYLSLMDLLTIRVDGAGVLYVNGSPVSADETVYTVTQVAEPTAENMPTVAIRNRPLRLTALKLDGVTGEPLEGVRFALYREVTDYHMNVPMPDYTPMDGFDELVTEATGRIPRIDLDDLDPGVYYLREKEPLSGYRALPWDVRLILSPTGQIGIQQAVYSAGAQQWVFSEITDGSAVVETGEDGNVTLRIRNTPEKSIQILKLDNGDDRPLSGAEFALYRIGQVENDRPKDGELPLRTMTTGENGIAGLGPLAGNTSYYLFETRSPDGYHRLAEPIVITTTGSGGVTAYLNGSGPLRSETLRDEETGVEIVRFTVYNASGYELPKTGGRGTALFPALGALLSLGAGAALLARRRRTV